MSTPPPSEADAAVREAIEMAILVELRAFAAHLPELTAAVIDVEIVPLGEKLAAGDVPHLVVRVLYEEASQTLSSEQRIDGFRLQSLLDCDYLDADLRQLCGQAIFGTTPINAVNHRELPQHLRCNAQGAAECEKLMRQAAAVRLFPDQAAEFGATAVRRE